MPPTIPEFGWDAVKQHIGIGSLPYFTAHQALASGEIVQVLPEWDFLSSYHGDLWLLYAPTQHLPPKLRVFIDYLVASLGQEPALKRLAQGDIDAV
ncbi:LysR substrate binding domain [Serratia fonticola]|uniref:LysR substrate binding domain n=1 Tax=Serratia fonticola TaxID=47917 RepID=A0A4V6KL90_SERFO|nr:LysR substrate binding domain [Serratia fonticola]